MNSLITLLPAYSTFVFPTASPPPLGRGVNPLGANFDVHTKDSGTNHVLVNLWLTPYKLTGWFASLDLRLCVALFY